MATITASKVNELRQRTGLGMMECKKALQETDGDVDKAIEFFRKKGVKTSVAAREAGEGRVAAFVSGDGRRGVLVEVKCNTDFTARNDIVAEVLRLAGQRLLEDPSADPSTDPVIRDKLVAVSQQTGENVQLGRTKTVEGTKVGKFEYTVTNKVAALVAVDKADAADELLSDVGLHLVAFKPVADGLRREDLPADLVAKEKDIAVEQAMATGKPKEIAEKIADGKLNAFYRERVLGEQDFINPDKFKGGVADYAKKHGATVTGFARLEVGLG